MTGSGSAQWSSPRRIHSASRCRQDISITIGDVAGGGLRRTAAAQSRTAPGGWRVQVHDHTLGIGCGTGQTTRQATRTARPGFALGVDISAPAIERAARSPGLKGSATSPSSTPTDLHGERASPLSGGLASGLSCRISSKSRPSPSISARTPWSADRSSMPVKTVSGPCRCHAIAGNAESNVAPRWPLILIMYLADAGSIRA
jgi:SAM-dependent methyltransferase